MKNKSKKVNAGKIIKYSIISVLLIIIVVIGVLVYKNIFAGVDSTRYNNIENYKLTKEEKDSVKDKLNQIEKIKDIDIYINSKIIKIYVVLEENVKFEDVKKVSNEALSGFSKENLSFYDVQIFIESEEKNDEYPQIGYKHKTNSKFSW